MKKIFYNENNKLRKEIYVLMMSVTLFIGAIVFTENYLSAEENQKYEKPTESQIKERLDSAVESGKLTQEEADRKLEAILSGEMKKKRFGMFGKKPTESQIKERLDSAVESGKLTQEEADRKLEAILSGEMKKKRFGMFGKKPTESQIKERLDSAVESGKITQEEADKKLEAILSGEMKRKKPGEYGKSEIIL